MTASPQDSPVQLTADSGQQAAGYRAGGRSRAGQGHAARALSGNPAYWFSMFAASALGTNLGDFWAEGLSLGLWTSFGSLAVAAGLAMLVDRRIGWRTNGAYWVAIVVLRAAATNVADFMTGHLKLGYGAVSVVLGVATLVAGYFTWIDKARSTTPLVDARYWTAMLIAGIFGTVAGDLASHTMGLYAAAGALCLTLVVALVLRTRFAPTSVVAYWCIVLAERCAGTPVGDGLASRHGLGLGMPVAMACTGGLLVAGLLADRMIGAARRG
jgi:uncharacterized membrane-anchored protein